MKKWERILLIIFGTVVFLLAVGAIYFYYGGSN